MTVETMDTARPQKHDTCMMDALILYKCYIFTLSGEILPNIWSWMSGVRVERSNIHRLASSCDPMTQAAKRNQ